MNIYSAQRRQLSAALLLLGSTLLFSGCANLSPHKVSNEALLQARGIVVYAIKDIPAGGTIEVENLELREIEMAKIPQDAFSSVQLIAGCTSKYGIASGQIVSQHDLAPRNDIRKISIDLSVQEYRELEDLASTTEQEPDELVHDWILEQLND